MSTPARKAQLIEQLREQRQQLLISVERLSEAETRRPLFTRGDLRSTIRDELIRLAHAEANYGAWLGRARAEREPDVTGDPFLRGDLDENDADGYAIEDVFGAMRLVRRETMALILDLEPAEFLRLVRTQAGPVSVDELISALARHDRELADAIVRRDSARLPRTFVRHPAREERDA